MLPLRAFAVRIVARILPSLALVATAGLSGCALTAGGAHQRVAVPQQVAPGVFAIIGQTADPTTENHGAVGNQGILIGADGVILIDTGTSQRYATELIDAVRQLTPKPIVLAIDTHQHPAFIFGNGALASQGVPILAHREVAELIEQRCEKCLKNLNNILGADEMAGTRVTVPTRIIEGATSMMVAGRKLDIVYFGQTSSPGSIAVLDRTSGVLFAGGLVSIDRIPDTKDARIEPWLAALATLKQSGAGLMVPGEGPVSPLARIDGLANYLQALRQTVKRVYAQGISLGAAATHAALPAFAAVPLYSPAHNKNVEQLYLRLERASLNGKQD